MSDTLNRIRAALQAVGAEELGSITRDTDITSDLDLDSIQFVQFLLALEQQVPGLEFSQEVLSEISFNRIGDLVDYVESLAATVAA